MGVKRRHRAHSTEKKNPVKQWRLDEQRRREDAEARADVREALRTRGWHGAR